jgi:hypothetical protein
MQLQVISKLSALARVTTAISPCADTVKGCHSVGDTQTLAAYKMVTTAQTGLSLFTTEPNTGEYALGASQNKHK